MDIHTLQTEIATYGYGPAMVKFWKIVNEQHQDFCPHNLCQWRQVWRAAKDIREDIRQEAADHLNLN